MSPSPRPPFIREIFHLARLFLLLFAIIAGSAAYWAVIGPDTISRRSDNPRRIDAEARIQRGAIYDRDGNLLAVTLREGGTASRSYFVPASYSALGYFSSIYGTGGIEAELNSILRGDALTTSTGDDLIQYLLQLPQQGSDVRITLAEPVQETLYNLLAPYRGASVVIGVPQGNILGIVSMPQYDPNRINEQWEIYRTDPDEPLINRAVQRAYPPGSLIQTPLLAAAVLLNTDIETPIENATTVVELDSAQFGCAVPLPTLALTLAEAYTFGCPAPFVSLSDVIGASALHAVLDSFMLLNPPDLMTALTVSDSAGTASRLTSFNPQPEVLGQGSVQITPLMAALMASAIINDGNAPFPHILDAVRVPGTSEWQRSTPLRPMLPMTTVDTARSISDLMRRAVARGAAQNAGRPEIDIGGHIGTAQFAGEPLSWFIGFATLGGRQALAAAVVIEGIDDVGIPADIGGAALESARGYLLQGSATIP